MMSFFFLFYLSAKSPSSLGQLLWNFAMWLKMGVILKFQGAVRKIVGQQMACFRTTLDFDVEYLWNGSRYLESENDVI